MINWEERVNKTPWDPILDFCFSDSPTLSSSLQKGGRCNFKTCRGFDTRCPGEMCLGLEIASWVPVFNPKLETHLYRAVSKTSSTHLKSLEGKPHVIPLRNGNPPNTFLGRSVIIWVVRRLNLTGIFVNVSPTGSFRKRARRKGVPRQSSLRKYTLGGSTCQHFHFQRTDASGKA